MTKTALIRAPSLHAASIKHLSKDKLLGPFIRGYGPLLIRRKPTQSTFESLAQSIIHQQISGAAARSVVKKFLALWPKKKFPAPKDVAAVSRAKLRLAGVSSQKVGYLKDLADKFLDGTINPKLFSKMRDEEIIEHVVAVKGIGEWTAQMFLMFTLGRPDVLPTGDLGIQKAFQKVFRLRKKPSPQKMQQLSKRWAGHRTVACFYLWRMMD